MNLGIGDRIKELRKSKKVTQRELARKIHRSERIVQKYESGEVSPPWNAVERIAEALNVPFNELVPDNSQEAIDLFDTPREIDIVFHEPIEEKIKDKNGGEFTRAIPLEKVRQRFFDVGYILKYREEAYYNGHLLSDEERRRALDMLKVLFPEYHKEGD
jgi:transcriptional regulator with XRE-family HTH domain